MRTNARPEPRSDAEELRDLIRASSLLPDARFAARPWLERGWLGAGLGRYYGVTCTRCTATTSRDDARYDGQARDRFIDFEGLHSMCADAQSPAPPRPEKAKRAPATAPVDGEPTRMVHVFRRVESVRL